MDLTHIAKQFGLTEEQTRAAFEGLAPVVAAGMQRKGDAGGGGLADIIASMTRSPSASTDTLTKHGNDTLGEIFGSKDVSRGVADQVSASTGIGASVLKKMLPVIASIVMAQLAKQMTSGGNSSGGGGLGDILGQVLGGGSQGQSQANTGGGGLGDILGQVLGGGQSGGGGLGDILGQVLGGGQTRAGGSLLDSVERSLRNK